MELKKVVKVLDGHHSDNANRQIKKVLLDREANQLFSFDERRIVIWGYGSILGQKG